ncbi:hypothetical protein MBRA_06405 [Methylobacterium brachiatum]|jgi:hypothetical protein|nr:hypothetical protein MBRA_06405 [Methylobacterium brachiatum]
MPNVITFPEQAPRPAPMARYAEIAVYGTVGPITVALTRRTDAMAGLIHVVVLGSAIGLEVVATLPDDDKGRAVADFVGPAVLRAAELTETEFAARPEVC